MRPHTLDEMSTIILIFCRDGANKIELIEKCYLNDIVSDLHRPIFFFPYSLFFLTCNQIQDFFRKCNDYTTC